MPRELWKQKIFKSYRNNCGNITCRIDSFRWQDKNPHQRRTRARTQGLRTYRTALPRGSPFKGLTRPTQHTRHHSDFVKSAFTTKDAGPGNTPAYFMAVIIVLPHPGCLWWLTQRPFLHLRHLVLQFASGNQGSALYRKKQRGCMDSSGDCTLSQSFPTHSLMLSGNLAGACPPPSPLCYTFLNLTECHFQTKV